MIEYMNKMDKIDSFSKGAWTLPEGAVLSAMHMVVRPSDLRAWQRDGTPYAVRAVNDLTGAGVNASLPKWRFRMPGVDDAVALSGRFRGKVFIGTKDLSKYYPSLPLGQTLQRVCWIRDPRADTVWRGTGPPSDTWLKW